MVLNFQMILETILLTLLKQFQQSEMAKYSLNNFKIRGNGGMNLIN